MMASNTFRLLVVTPDRQLLLKDNLTWVKATLLDGEIGIKANHAPLLAETVDGPVIFSVDDEKQSIDIHAGILKIDKKGVVIFTTGHLDSEIVSKNVEIEQMQYERLAKNLIRHIDHA